MRRFAALALFLLASPVAASIRGTIVGNGKPVANAKIIAYANERGEETLARAATNRPRPVLATTTSSADGTFTLPVDGAGSVLVRVDAPGFRSLYEEEALGDSDVLISLAAAKPREYALRLPGGPVAGARVIVANASALAEATTDERGKFMLDDVGGAMMLVIHPRVALHATALQPRDGVIDVEAGVPMKGKVLDANGKGVGNARISIDDVPAAVSAADGSFTIASAPPHYTMLAAEAGELGGHIGPTAAAPVIRVAPRIAVNGVIRDAEQRPLRGLAIALMSESGSDTAVTDEKGRFAMRVAAGKYSLALASTIYHIDAAELNVQKPLVKELVAKRAPIVAGIVKTEDNKPVAGAQLAFVLEMPNEQAEQMMAGLAFENLAPAGFGVFTTGSDGRFRINAPEFQMPIRLVVYKRGLPLVESDAIQPGKGNVTIVMSKGADVGGTVRDNAGHPLAGVKVTTLRPGRVLVGAFADPPQTDDEGRFTAPLAAGNWRMTFVKDGYLPRVETTAAPRTLAIALESAASIRGRLLRKDGSGVANAMIFEEMKGATATGADGSFTLANVLPGEHVLQYFTQTGTHGQKSVTAPADDVRIVLDETGVVRGRVVDAAGAPVTSFSVTVTRGPEDFGRPQPFGDPDGRFVVNDAPLGDATVTVTASGFAAATKSVTVEAGKATAEVTLTLRRGRTVRGKVVSASGEPLAEVAVGRSDAESVMTNADGTYEVSGVDTAQTSLMFMKSGFVTATRRVPAGDDDVKLDVQLYAGVALAGHVVTADGQPVANAEVSATSSTAGAGSESGETNSEGAFRIEGLAPARYDLTATVESESLQGSLADVDVARVRDVTIRMKPRSAAVIYGEVAGIDLAGRRVSVSASSADSSATAEIDTSGKYRIANAPTGTVTLRASVYAGGVYRATRPAVVDVAPHSEVRADLRFADTFPISGRVLRGGAPMIGAKIDFEDESDNRFSATAGDGGAYTANVSAGRYHVSVGSYSTDRTISGPDTVDINVDLGQVVVTVVDAASALPIELATVSGRDTASSTHAVVTARTNGSGQATLDAPRNVTDIVVEKQGYATAVVPAGGSAVTVKLTRSDETVVRLVDARDGRPLSGYAVARDAAGRVIASANEAGMDGTIRFPLLPGRYRFSASANGYGSHTIAADVPGNDIQIPLPRGGKLLLQSHADLHGTARLIQPDGEEYVRCWCSGIADIRIDGRTTLVESIAPGSYTLEVLQAGSKARQFAVSVIEGQTVTVPID